MDIDPPPPRNDQIPTLSRFVQRLDEARYQIRALRLGIIESAREQVDNLLHEVLGELFAELIAKGKQVDLKKRQKRQANKERLLKQGQHLLGRFGLAEADDIEELNRKIAELARSVEKLINVRENTPIVLDRRNQDRRQRNMKLMREKRLKERRHDSIAA